MKSRHSPNLYEILRSASAPKESAPVPALKPEPAAASAVAVAPPPPPPPVIREVEPIVEAPPPPPIVERERVVVVPAPAPPTPTPGLGERSLNVTYNTLLFSGLVVVGAIFLSFTLGLRTGRSQPQSETAPVSSELTNATPQAPAVPAPKFTIRLIEYRTPTSRDYTTALDAAVRYKNELERLGFRDAVVETIGRTTDRRLVLRYGEYSDAAAAPVKETFKKLKEVKLDKGAKEPTFAKTAQFQTR